MNLISQVNLIIFIIHKLSFYFLLASTSDSYLLLLLFLFTIKKFVVFVGLFTFSLPAVSRLSLLATFRIYCFVVVYCCRYFSSTFVSCSSFQSSVFYASAHHSKSSSSNLRVQNATLSFRANFQNGDFVFVVNASLSLF